MSNSKQITISADIKVATTQAEAALKKLSKSFKDAFSETNANKMFKEMKMISPLINQIDSSLGKMMKSMVKDDARKQLKLMNEALKDQSKQIDANIRKYRELTDQIENASDAQKKGLEHERQIVTKNIREGMGRSQEFGQRRDEAKQTLGVSQADLLKIAAVMATAGRVGGAVANYVGGFESKKMGYEAQRDSVTNSYLSGVTSGGLDMGVLAASGKLGRGMDAARSGVTGEYAKRALEFGGDALAAGTTGFAMGGPIGAGIGVAGAVGAHAGKNADLALMPQAREALLAGKQQENIGSALQSTAYVRELIADRMAKAHGRMSAMEAIGGGLGKNLGIGAGMGFSQGQTLGALGAIGQSGLLGGERTDVTAALRLQRQGLGTAEQTAGLAGTAMMGLSKQTTVMQQLKKAMEEGTKKGVETSLVKDLVGATIQIANQGTARSQDLDTYQKMMEAALGGKKASEIGRGDISAAQNAVAQELSLRGGGGNPVLQSMRMLDITESLKSAGGDIDKLSPGDVFSLSQAQAATQITDMQKTSLLKAFGGDKDKLDEFLNGFDETAGMSVSRASSPGSAILQKLSTKAGLDEFKFNQQAAADYKKSGINPEFVSEQEDQASKLASEYQVSRGVSRQVAESTARLTAGTGTEADKKGLTDVSGKSTDRMLATVSAVAELAKDSLMAQKTTGELVKSSVAETYASVKLLTDKNAEGFQPLLKMADGQYDLNVSMEGLTAAIVANTRALRGEKETGEEKTVMKDVMDRVNLLFGKIHSGPVNDRGMAKDPAIFSGGLPMPVSPVQANGGRPHKAASGKKK